MSLFSSRCMLLTEVCHRAARLSSQASYAVMVDESLTRPGSLQTLHTCCVSNSSILHSNYILLPSDLGHAYTWRKNGIAKEALVLQRVVWTTLWDIKAVKSDGLVDCLVENADLGKNHQWRKFELACLKKKKVFWLSGDFLVRYFRFNGL